MSSQYIVGLLIAALSVAAVGLSFASWLHRWKITSPADQASPLFFGLCLGFYWNTVLLIAAYFASLHLQPVHIYAKSILELAILLTSVVLNRVCFFATLGSAFRDRAVVAFGSIGFMLGTWAMLQFPHVYDSGQIIWSQQVLDSGLGSQPISSMMGYSALVLPLGVLFKAIPIVTTAATFKPMLLGLLGIVAVLVGRSLTPQHRLTTAAIFALLCLSSTFGTYGLLELGKDSAWGVLIATAFFACLYRLDACSSVVEFALYFAVASSFGVIATPYMVAAYVIWLFIGQKDTQVLRTLPAIITVGAPILPTVLAGFLQLPLFKVYLMYMLLAVGVVIVARWKTVGRMQAQIARVLLYPALIAPLFLAFVSSRLFPTALPFPVWVNADGSIVSETRPPLDGVTSFYGYFMDAPTQRLLLEFGLLAAVIVPFVVSRPKKAGIVALAAMPFFVIVVCLVRTRLHLHVLSDFNTWDMVKDIPLWLGGTLFVLCLITALSRFAAWSTKSWIYPLLVWIVTLTCLFSTWRAIDAKRFTQPVTYGRYASHANADFAQVADALWARLRGRPLFIDPRLALSSGFFYSFQMFEARPSIFDASKLDDELANNGLRIGYLITPQDLPKLRDAIRRLHGSLEVLVNAHSEDAVLVAVNLDGRSTEDLSAAVNSVSITSGRFADERTNDGGLFTWMRAHASLLVSTPTAPQTCLHIYAFSMGEFSGPETLVVKDADKPLATVDLHGRSSEAPSKLELNLDSSKGIVLLSLSFVNGEKHFPSDGRPISYGLLLPVTLTKGRCELATERGPNDGRNDK
jgi:hypothetical protein